MDLRKENKVIRVNFSGGLIGSSVLSADGSHTVGLFALVGSFVLFAIV